MDRLRGILYACYTSFRSDGCMEIARDRRTRILGIPRVVHEVHLELSHTFQPGSPRWRRIEARENGGRVREGEVQPLVRDPSTEETASRGSTDNRIRMSRSRMEGGWVSTFDPSVSRTMAPLSRRKRLAIQTDLTRYKRCSPRHPSTTPTTRTPPIHPPTPPSLPSTSAHTRFFGEIRVSSPLDRRIQFASWLLFTAYLCCRSVLSPLKWVGWSSISIKYFPIKIRV